MADFNWGSEVLNPNLMNFELLDVSFFLSLIKTNNPVLIDIYGHCCIKVTAFYSGRGLKNHAKAIHVGFLPVIDVESKRWQDRLRDLINIFFKEHSELIKLYIKYHPLKESYFYGNN